MGLLVPSPTGRSSTPSPDHRLVMYESQRRTRRPRSASAARAEHRVRVLRVRRTHYEDQLGGAEPESAPSVNSPFVRQRCRR